ncbi:hypothetical protein [Candidatus Stoquefichus massiliensis]|nr:hypothetical protein [Candidatus Stoquefichus massiliensis]
MFNKLTSILEKVLMPITDYMNNNKYICAIRDSFTMMMPMIIIGIICFII